MTQINERFCLACLQDEPCRYNSTGMAAQCKGYKEVPIGDEHALAVALFKVGPVSVGIDATQSTFLYYRKGQWTDTAGPVDKLVFDKLF